ncbi:hypothetical protein GBA52_024361 [Prunus armeniaca]|nr:hypothetical protein GBA52_024361 [Prunus armeniaca]
MEDLELRFGANLRLSDKERQGVRIGESDLGSQFVGHHNTLVAKVHSQRVVNKEGFIASFSRMWKGIAGVSIKEFADKSFLVRFENHRDKARVLGMEPWTYHDALVLLSEVTVGCDVRSVDLNLGRAFVEFPEVGSIWVSFLYEYLPEYCFLCGCLGHPSRVCLDKVGECSPQRGGVETFYAFAGLEAVEDMRGRPLKSIFCRAAQGSPNSGSWLPHAQHAPEKGLSLVETIRKQRELDARRKQVLAQAWDAGLIGSGGVIHGAMAGYPYTWRNRRENGLIHERLDRCLASEPWLRNCPEARVMHVALAGSDHAAFLLSTKPSTTRWHRRFVYDSRWGRHTRCKDVVSERWQKYFPGSRGDQLIRKLGWVRTGLVQWWRQERRNSSDHISLIRRQLQSAYTDQDFDGSREEVFDTIKSLSPSTSPRPDGFTGAFFQHHWVVVGTDVFRLVQSFFHSGKLPRRLNHTLITLIPKIPNPRNMKQWRPISLCNVIYKIISKILTNRLKTVLLQIISPHQSAFVAERQITDNILVVHEILHSLQRSKRSDPKTLALKLDMAKAFDRVEWPFLIAMMKKLGFPYQFCSWIFECISTVSYSVLINGAAIGHVNPSRGLRQGDPLSPFLFLICAEGLTSLIKAFEERQALHVFRLHGDGISISHLLFADDSVLFCRADEREAQFVLNILQCYEAASGIMADFGASKRKVFDEVRRKLDGKLHGWAEQFLSPAGKEVLIKAVAMAMPCYAMSCFKLPVSLCKEIEAAIARFWWKSHKEKHGIHWVSWANLSQLKKAGGLGFRDIQCFNLALLAKVGWRILHNPSSLLACLLHDKYFAGAFFLSATSQKSSSWGWKGILQGRRLLESGLRWRIGDGIKVQVRNDPWLPSPYTFRTLSRHPDLPLMVHELIDPLLKAWKQDVINRCFTPEEATRIFNLPISRWGCLDKLIWHFSSHGQYIVRSGYELALHLQRNEHETPHAIIPGYWKPYLVNIMPNRQHTILLAVIG